MGHNPFVNTKFTRPVTEIWKSNRISYGICELKKVWVLARVVEARGREGGRSHFVVWLVAAIEADYNLMMVAKSVARSTKDTLIPRLWYGN